MPDLAAEAASPQLRRARPEDAPQLAELFWRVRSESVPSIPMIVHPRASVGPFVQDVLLRHFEVWVADCDGELVGFMALMPPGVLGHLYIAERQTGQGLGTRFLEVARDRFPDGIELWAFESNTRALRFYERHGFVPVERTEGDNEEGAPDVRLVWRPRVSATVASYTEHAQAYAAGLPPVSSHLAGILDDFAAALPLGATVLEIGSGSGRDARELEARGLRVRRTDVAQGFVDLLRAQGDAADLLDPLHDDLGGPYDGVYASACLLHVERADLGLVLAHLHAATRPGGTLFLDVKEGDGERWAAQGSIEAPRHFVYWRTDQLLEKVREAGWEVTRCGHSSGQRDDWIEVQARRPG